MSRRLAPAVFALALSTLLGAGAAQAAGDAAKGEKVFNKCKACHTLEAGKNRVGPSLHGVFGRVSGTSEGFKYSDAMKAAAITWDETTMRPYLADPKKVVPGTKMTFGGIKKDSDLDDLIAYLKQATM
jgi:cytochrome c